MDYKISGSGNVVLVKKKSGSDKNTLYALKILNKKAELKHPDRTSSELEILKSVQECPFLGQLHYAFKSRNNLYLVLEYMPNGDLFELLNNNDLEEDEVIHYLAELLIAVEKLHQMGIVHRDLKLETILIDSDGHLVLSDFGLSKICAPDNKGKRASEFVGTLCYMAPEILKKGKTYYDYRVDFWSIGIIAYELLIGDVPFNVKSGGKARKKMYRKVCEKEMNFPDDVSVHFKDLILKFLELDPSKRLGSGPFGMKEIKNQKIFKGLNWEDIAQKRVTPPQRFLKLETGSKNEESHNSGRFPSSDDESSVDDGNIFENYYYVAEKHVPHKRDSNEMFAAEALLNLRWEAIVHKY